MAKKKIKVPKVVDGVPVGEVEIEVDDSAGPQWGANDQHRLLNKPMVRVDGPAKACGTAANSSRLKRWRKSLRCLARESASTTPA